MTAHVQRWRNAFEDSALSGTLQDIPAYVARPAEVMRGYDTSNLSADVIAGATVAVILLPQAIAYALIAELPPYMGLYTAVVAAIVGALWGSSHQLHTGPTNAASLLVLTVLLPVANPGTPEYLAAAGVLAVMVGVIRVVMGLAKLGVLVNFVSDSVIVGFTAGAGILIAAKQLRHLFRLDFPATPSLIDTLRFTLLNISETHVATLAIGLGTIVLILVLRYINRKIPDALIAMIAAAAVVGFLRLDQAGVIVIAELPRGLPPIADLPLFDVQLLSDLSTGALAVAIIGLVEAVSISRSISAKTGQRLDSNQEFVGQGLANIVAGIFSGFPSSGSFSRSAVNHEAGARTPIAAVISAGLVLVAMLFFAPWAEYVPRTALAGVLIVTAFGMIDYREMYRIWQGTHGDALIMVVTFTATLLLPLQFAVLSGIAMSLIYYLMQTTTPRVRQVLPDQEFRNLVPWSEQPECPQLAIIDILGDLYFGAGAHVEDEIREHMTERPEQRFLLLRLQGVQRCDISGVHVLESIVKAYRDRGGDVFITGTRKPVLMFMKAINFYEYLGEENFLSGSDAISHIFYRILDPTICIYECPVRTFRECQNLPKQDQPIAVPKKEGAPLNGIPKIKPQELWEQLRSASPPLVIDVREPREYRKGHIPQAAHVPFGKLEQAEGDLPDDRDLVLVCRSGRRSTHAAQLLRDKGYDNVAVLDGGTQAWEAADLLAAVEEIEEETTP